MAQNLESIFQELGISQYLDIFLEQGFDTWDTILDITESDLDALGVKLGHRRKLQRRIANSRGHAPDVSLVSPTRASVEEPKTETQRPDQPRPENKEGPIQAKRKYRRHPKPDENAPERPPSAYVLFSNKMRDELKGRNLTFTEIAKLVGEHWQNLTPAEKEPYETSALKAKEKYNHDLAEYKKTPEFRKYTAYLADFKARQASANQAKESSKRQKLDSGVRLTNGSASATPGSLSSTGSGTESQPGSEPPPNRKQRVGSVVSLSESQYSTAVPTPISQHQHPADEAVHSPTSTQFDRESLHSTSPRATHSRSRRPTWTDTQSNPEAVPTQVLPSISSFSGVLPSLNGASRSPEMMNGFGYAPSRHPNSLPPPLPSAGSTASSGSAPSYPHTPSHNPLPIHALCSNEGKVSPVSQPPRAAVFEVQPPPFPAGPPPPLQEQKSMFPHMPTVAQNGRNGYHSPPQLLRFQSSSSSSGTEGSIAPSHAPSHASSQTSLGAQDRSTPKLDGLNQLSRAAELLNNRR
ncbi:hmg box protein [Colletotrichum chrysophilum]|uniref:Hmg box protein n=1 Tax=Colletotrichum chrysophilum TaxID=1836956 RepID=A0AAD9A8D8_9PEZI|nr:hmg box protein [Colletotrichum chrysophilum]